MSISFPGLEGSFDNDSAESMLSLSIGQVTHTSDLIKKSMYDFDLETPEGIEKLMALLPIMDPEILKDIMTALWPGYPTDIDARRHRLEIKGYLKDFLESYDEEDAAEQPGQDQGQETDPGDTGPEVPPEEPGEGFNPGLGTGRPNVDPASAQQGNPDEAGAPPDNDPENIQQAT